MAKRELEEINASSMADIAFLLLVFFLVTSTFNKVKVLEDKLPQKVTEEVPPVKVKEWNILDIVANKNDEIQVEKENFFTADEASEITQFVLDFYVHPRSQDNNKWPEVTTIKLKDAEDSLRKYSNYSDGGMAQMTINAKKSSWEKRVNAIKMFGGDQQSIQVIADQAVIAIQMDNTTKYSTYISIMDAILAGLNELKEEKILMLGDRPLSSYNPKIEEDKEVLDLLEVIYPKRIMKKKGIASAE